MPRFGSRVRTVISSNQETKFFTQTTTAGVIDSTPLFVHLTAIPQGTERDERIANEVRLVSVLAEMRIFNVSTVNFYTVRCIVFKEKGGGVPSTPPISTIAGYPDTDAFVIKQDIYQVLAPLVVNGNPVLDVSYRRRFPAARQGPAVLWDGPLAADVVTGAWSMFIVSDNLPGTNDVQFSGYSTVYYKDT